MNDQKNPEFVVILTAPRSLSTIFIRNLMVHSNVDIYNDELSSVYFSKVLNNESVISIEELILPLETEIEKSIANNKTIIFKDMVHWVDYFNIYQRWQMKYNTKFLYLIRHPKAQYISYQKALAKEVNLGRFDEKGLYDLLHVEFYEQLWDTYLGNKGKIILAEDLQENPAEVLKEAFIYCGLDFKEEYLHYKALEVDEIPKGWNYWLHWYTDCINSTNLRKGVTDISNIEVKEEHKCRVENSMKYYQKIEAESKRQILNFN